MPDAREVNNTSILGTMQGFQETVMAELQEQVIQAMNNSFEELTIEGGMMSWWNSLDYEHEWSWGVGHGAVAWTAWITGKALDLVHGMQLPKMPNGGIPL